MMPVKIWPTMSTFLRAPWTNQEQDEAAQELAALDAKLAGLEERISSQGGEINLPALELARSYASNTLARTREETLHWQKALNEAGQSLSENKHLTFEMIAHWNQIIRNDFVTPVIREQDLYLTSLKLVPAAELAVALEDFKNFVLAETESEPVRKASQIYQWLITIHPFPNGNGRTSRLAADYVLMQNSYVPLVFPTPLTSSAALFVEKPRNFRPFAAFRQIVRGLERSIEILALPK